MAAATSLKAGESFFFTGEMRDINDEPVDLTGVTIRSQVRAGRGGDEVLADLVFEAIDLTLGTYAFGASSEVTAAWPAGTHNCDVRYDFPDGTVAITDTFSIFVTKAVTRT